MVPKKKGKDKESTTSLAHTRAGGSARGFQYTEGLEMVPEGWSEFHEEQPGVDLEDGLGQMR